MTPEEFVRIYKAATVNEEAVAQSHFIDLCDLLGVRRPVAADGSGDFYRFEKKVSKIAGGKGFADVWFDGHFGWEYKGKTKSKSLAEAYVQLQAYREDLGNPPLLIVCDINTIQVHTNFTATTKVIKTYTLDDLLNDRKRQELKNAWVNPEAFNPAHTTEDVTVGAVADLDRVARALKGRGEPDEAVADFLVKVVFTLFAEDVGILPRKTFAQLLDAAHDHPEDFQEMAQQLFSLMKDGGKSMLGRVPHFNGGLFTSDYAPELKLPEVQTLMSTARRDWRALSPAVFGVLFERIIDPDKRGQLGAHYTGLRDILDVVEPVILSPLRAEWEALRQRLNPLAEEIEVARAAAEAQRTGLFAAGALGEHLVDDAVAQLRAFQARVAAVKVLDPAMGSGNFLYVTLRLLLDLELEVRATIRSLSGQAGPPTVTPHQMLGIEVNAKAHEIASAVLWIGYLQWLSEHGESLKRSPVLEVLPGLEHRDAVLNGTVAAEWPDAEFIVGNPPFLGNTRMRSDLGNTYAETIRQAYEGRVPGFADFVTYWVEKAREQVESGVTKRVGLITTNSIRGGANATVLARVLDTGSIFRAWPDRVWIQEGAAVRVSVICFDDGTQQDKVLVHHEGNEDDEAKRTTVVVPVTGVHADLSSGPDLRQAVRLPENAGRSFEGVKPAGKFDVPGPEARSWLDLPNPSGASNADVMRPYVTGEDLVEGSKDRWVVDFNQLPLEEAEKYRRPMKYLRDQFAAADPRKNAGWLKRTRWWLYDRARPEMRDALRPLTRYIGTSRVAKHRVFAFLATDALPSDLVTVIAADDDFTFGVLNSAPHLHWALRLGSSLEDRPRYTPTTTFETFPFPRPTDSQRAKVEEAARYLEKARAFLHAKDTPGRTGVKLGLTAMYNMLTEYRATGQEALGGVATLADAHDLLDAAVAAAYGWNDWPLTEDDVLTRLLDLNLERAAPVVPQA